MLWTHSDICMLWKFCEVILIIFIINIIHLIRVICISILMLSHYICFNVISFSTRSLIQLKAQLNTYQGDDNNKLVKFVINKIKVGSSFRLYLYRGTVIFDIIEVIRIWISIRCESRCLQKLGKGWLSSLVAREYN